MPVTSVYRQDDDGGAAARIAGAACGVHVDSVDEPPIVDCSGVVGAGGEPVDRVVPEHVRDRAADDLSRSRQKLHGDRAERRAARGICDGSADTTRQRSERQLAVDAEVRAHHDRMTRGRRAIEAGDAVDETVHGDVVRARREAGHSGNAQETIDVPDGVDYFDSARIVDLDGRCPGLDRKLEAPTTGRDEVDSRGCGACHHRYGCALSNVAFRRDAQGATVELIDEIPVLGTPPDHDGRGPRREHEVGPTRQPGDAVRRWLSGPAWRARARNRQGRRRSHQLAGRIEHFHLRCGLTRVRDALRIAEDGSGDRPTSGQRKIDAADRVIRVDGKR